jgi:Atypical PilZ domain, cyclic di-GMP receptor
VFDGGDTIVLFDELAYEDVLALCWIERTHSGFDSATQRQAERNARLLQAHEALDEPASADKGDDDSPHAAEIARLDFKVNLLLDLVGQLVTANMARPVAVPVRINACGASWQSADSPPTLGAVGQLQVHISDALAQPLLLPGRIAAVSDTGLVRARFELLGEVVAGQLERLVFRRHRRRIAGTRSPRRA